MKHIIIATLLLTIMYHCLAQEEQPHSKAVTAADYFKLSKENKFLAKLSLCTGLVAYSIYSLKQDNLMAESSSSLNKILLAFAITTAGASIPLFISSAKNKKKALLIASGEHCSLYIPRNPGGYIAGITLRIPLGK